MGTKERTKSAVKAEWKAPKVKPTDPMTQKGGPSSFLSFYCFCVSRPARFGEDVWEGNALLIIIIISLSISLSLESGSTIDHPITFATSCLIRLNANASLFRLISLTSHLSFSCSSFFLLFMHTHHPYRVFISILTNNLALSVEWPEMDSRLTLIAWHFNE